MKRLIFFILVLAGLTVMGIMGTHGYRYVVQRDNQKNIPGPTPAPPIKMTIVEGWTLRQIADDLNNNSAKRPAEPHLATQDEFLSAEKNFDASDYSLLSSKPADSGLEGFLFPDTYFLPGGVASGTYLSNVLIQKALDNFTDKFNQAETGGDTANKLNSGVSIFQIVTLASIIEKETNGDPQERATVAGIFYNRLNTGMLLQSDATINYALQQDPSLGNTSFTQVDSPYNTYLHKGLPPGPICNPSLSSLVAALYPAQTDYFYFLVTPDGQIFYAKTDQEQLQNQQKYLK